MAVIKLRELKSVPALMQNAIRMIAEHDGRLFIGSTPQDRVETPKDQLILTVLNVREFYDGVPSQDEMIARNEELAKTIYLTEKPKPQKPTRAERWGAACSEASSGLSTLVDLQSEFSEWKDGIPENLQSSETYQKLESICDLDLESAQSTIEEAEGCELPQGFGRD